jgi:hypothetical protein
MILPKLAYVRFFYPMAMANGLSSAENPPELVY